MKQLNKKIKSGKMEIDEENPFEMFIASTNIRYCYYHETHKILGNTYGMCVLQDFEAMTPNLLARTIETVEGGGAIVLLIHSVESLKQLYTLSMDVHSRFVSLSESGKDSLEMERLSVNHYRTGISINFQPFRTLFNINQVANAIITNFCRIKFC